MERDGVTPDLWTYNSLANVLGSCGEWERAVSLLDDMRARGLKPDVVTYSALISACEKAGQVRSRGYAAIAHAAAGRVLASKWCSSGWRQQPSRQVTVGLHSLICACDKAVQVGGVCMDVNGGRTAEGTGRNGE